MLIRIQILLKLLSLIASVKAACPENYVDIGSGCIYAAEEQLTYVEAQYLCHQTHGELAVLSDCQIFTDAVHYVEENAHGLQDDFWVGGTYSVSTWEWQWRDGSTVAMGIPYWGQSAGGSDEPYGADCAGYCRYGTCYLGAYGCTNAYSPLCSAVPEPEGFCNLPFVAVGSMCVHFASSEAHSWSSSRIYCQDLGGDLLVFETCQQFIEVTEHIYEQNLLPDLIYWVGGSYLAQSGWFWIDESPMHDGVPLWGQYTDSPLLPLNSTSERCLELSSLVRHRFSEAVCMEIKRPLCMASPLA